MPLQSIEEMGLPGCRQRFQIERLPGHQEGGAIGSVREAGIDAPQGVAIGTPQRIGRHHAHPNLIRDQEPDGLPLVIGGEEGFEARDRTGLRRWSIELIGVESVVSAAHHQVGDQIRDAIDQHHPRRPPLGMGEERPGRIFGRLDRCPARWALGTMGGDAGAHLIVFGARGGHIKDLLVHGDLCG